jgi:hypothetical protein
VKDHSVSTSRLLLLELVCNLFLFALCAAVCILFLVRARALSRESTDLTHAVYLAQSAAEVWRAGDIPVHTQENGYTVITESTGADTCVITVSRNGTVLYTLEGVARS